MNEVLLHAFNGLSLGSILLLISMGLAFSFGLMNVINMAHGEMLMIGAYLFFTFSAGLALPAWAAVVLALIGAALWSCALACGIAGADGHLAATCSLGAALGGAAFGVLALEAIAPDPQRLRGLGLARAATGISAATVGLNVAAFAGPFTP